MEYDILSLKNLYRLLTVNDYPIYSTGVIQKKELHGLTLLKFWQDMLRIEFRKEKYGKDSLFYPFNQKGRYMLFE